MRHLLPLFLVLVPMLSVAQDRINLMNGQVLQGRVLGQSSLEIRYQVPKGARLLDRTEPTENVFSVTDSVGREKVWYFMDTIFGNDLTVDQMRWFINGERDARKGYKPWGPMIIGFVAGAAPVIALDMEVNSLLIPPVYAGIMAWPRVHVTRGSISDPNMEGDPYYAEGYSAAARPKRVVKSLLSSALGVAVGLAVRQLIINPNNPDTF
ncbi:MAG TPA: hypothetical protein VGE21_14225 [Flavobacteriales bacterium]